MNDPFAAPEAAYERPHAFAHRVALVLASAPTGLVAAAMTGLYAYSVFLLVQEPVPAIIMGRAVAVLAAFAIGTGLVLDVATSAWRDRVDRRQRVAAVAAHGFASLGLLAELPYSWNALAGLGLAAMGGIATLAVVATWPSSPS